ncbi:PilZ domain-containing protein [Sphingomonas bacterium]|uniref:PilZ domain-containing protein n=1 Tax=Sphingomonas bacterium TaxID=1895847 RepID=UPI00157712EC|nr:PilZ domain-containing protein [Sphingomonas bacterium]
MTSASAWAGDERSEPREAVHHRARATHPDGRLLPLLIVNISHGGLMVRCDAPCEPGDKLRIALPRIGAVVAEVRWVLGGRLGCRLERPLGMAEYLTLLSGLTR